MTGVITQITGVFTALAQWITSTLPDILGTLAVCGLAISVFFLLMGLIQNFLHFRG